MWTDSLAPPPLNTNLLLLLLHPDTQLLSSSSFGYIDNIPDMSLYFQLYTTNPNNVGQICPPGH